MITSNELRYFFLDFFKKRSHTLVKSSSLVPSSDPTLMFTNSGMVQFKDVFTGKDSRSYSTAASIQKCVRAGGKHNDLQNVGHTKRHLTFFEMLGNFSFGDYFKEEAIKYAWEFLTKELKLDSNRLYITVYHDDHEAFKIWKKVSSFEDAKIIKIATKDNFWAMGDTGPCGPCTEIFYDQGAPLLGGLPGTKDQDGDRYIEIWNLVFMQYEQLQSGEMRNLLKKSVDTGMGLERLAGILQGTHDNFETDVLQTLIKLIEDITSTKTSIAHRVISDHLRSSAFLIADGVVPSNEGRGYVLRRIIRRAVRYIPHLNYKNPLLHQLVGILTAEMGSAYPELVANQGLIAEVLKHEEEVFADTLDRGLYLLEAEIKNLEPGSVLSGKTAFKLHDTYGFPVDLTEDILKEKNILLDMKEFEEAMAFQKTMARASWSGSGGNAVQDIWFSIKERSGQSEFVGYSETSSKGIITALVQNGVECSSITNAQEFYLIANQTPFYAESGGQMGDIGIITIDGSANIQVIYTEKPLSGLHAHKCLLITGQINVGDTAHFAINIQHREGLKRNHTATHLLHSSLRQNLGPHVVQKGSLVAHNKLRFDFSHKAPVARQMLDAIENHVNGLILKDFEVKTEVMSQDEALHTGAMALFGEKYEDSVRVVSVVDVDLPHSIELCGGTHVDSLGKIGLFKILSDTAVSAGIRRIEAITGEQSLERAQKDYNALKDIATQLQANEKELQAKLDQLIKENKRLSKIEAKLKRKDVGILVKDAHLTNLGKIRFLTNHCSDADADVNEVRELVQSHALNHQDTVTAIFVFSEDKLVIICSVSKSLHPQISAKDIITMLLNIAGGKGGGSVLIAQGTCNKEQDIKILKSSIEAYLKT